MSTKGLIHIYCGDGKGKTTAAIGLGVRAAGCGKRVLMLQFLKGNASSEYAAIKDIKGFSIEAVCDCVKFVYMMNDAEREENKALNEKRFVEAVERCADLDMIILDEIIGCIACGQLDEDLLAGFLQNKPESLEVVLTGRMPSDKLVRLADYVSEVKKIKHPFDNGVDARKGIEF